MESSPLSPGARLLGRPGVLQFVKFCLVGASSTVIDLGILFFLTHTFNTPWALAKIFSFSCGVTNGFIWNSRWTFSHIEGNASRARYMMFFAVNIVGLALSLVIMKTIFVTHFHTWQHPNPKGLILLVAQMIAIPIVVFWNFFANKHWTFKA